MNASMGTLMMIIVSVMAVIKGDLFGIDSTMIAAMPALSENIGLIGVAMICFVVSSNFVAAVSVTLEGNSLWVVKSLPIPTHLVLDAKWYVHFLFTAIPAVLFSVIVGLVVELSWGWVLAMVAMAIIASATFAVMDLAVNLKFPNLHWTNETAAIKQGISTVIAMFGGWGIALLPIFGWFLFGKYLPAWGYYCIGLAYFIAIGIGFWLWLRKRGVKIFEELSV